MTRQIQMGTAQCSGEVFPSAGGVSVWFPLLRGNSLGGDAEEGKMKAPGSPVAVFVPSTLPKTPAENSSNLARLSKLVLDIPSAEPGRSAKQPRRHRLRLRALVDQEEGAEWFPGLQTLKLGPARCPCTVSFLVGRIPY